MCVVWIVSFLVKIFNLELTVMKVDTITMEKKERSTDRIRRHLGYFWYLVKHKWYVFYFGNKLGVSWRRLAVHDLSKFLPNEWYSYSYYYFGKHATEQDRLNAEQQYRHTWTIHFSRNDHHFEWWNGEKMSEQATREMVADWVGAGVAKKKPDIIGWFSRWKYRDKVHPETMVRVEQLLEIVKSWKLTGDKS